MLIPTCLIKLCELMLTVACLTLHHYSYDLTDVPTLMLCSGTYVGYVVVLSGEIVGEAVSAAADAYVDAWWSSSGSVLFAACGGLTLHSWKEVPVHNRKSYAQAAAICALANASLLLIDALIAICSAHKEEGSTRTKCPKSATPC
ncbi:uncharacterized protein LOC110377628 isoform X1 [Helicoverpa armigera]|uniref:uncharacterized protein LOC124633544 n=1 Tax=Helicoverpa zea TaxID=7113 RepID=UPI000B392941|nr:uncharacterized protein LOC110377628 isoform X1 [Helicoverpa armigera]XP_047024760.1 uncharacterized protein LOC124633544 [Helicoverpa zea]PZC86535.1 hypothetical protein B5X24_HaOG209254 [Helicoverpa armigera]